MSMYADIILDHFRNPKNKGSFKHPTKTVHVTNPFCGDEITMEYILDGNIIKDIKFSGGGCAISQAAASILTEYAKDKSIKELRKMAKDDMIDLLGIELTPIRLKCGLLAWEALHALIATYE